MRTTLLKKCRQWCINKLNDQRHHDNHIYGPYDIESNFYYEYFKPNNGNITHNHSKHNLNHE